MKYIAKPDTWFKAGTEVVLEDYLYDLPRYVRSDGTIQQASKSGLFRGIRVSHYPEQISEHAHPAGGEYEDGEICGYDEFEITE